MPTSSCHLGSVTRASGIPVPPLSSSSQAGPTRSGTTPVTEVAGPSEMQESQPRPYSPLAGPAAAPLSTQVIADADPLGQGPFTSALPFSTSTLPLFTPSIPIPTSGPIPEHPVSQPACLDAVVDALLAEVSDLRHEHSRLRLESHHLQEENSHARDTEARVRGELEAVKTRVAELSQNTNTTQQRQTRGPFTPEPLPG
jgi:hypothetical protein